MSMEVTKLDDARPRPRHVAIGTFDGVHLGHREVIDGVFEDVLRFCGSVRPRDDMTLMALGRAR